MHKFISRVMFCVATELVAMAIVDVINVIRCEKDVTAENN